MRILDIMEPITERGLRALKPGEWIWDNKRIPKQAHEIGSFRTKKIFEPIGFRQVHVLNYENYKNKKSDTPFMLSDMYKGGNSWTIFEENRFYRFKRDKGDENHI